MNTKRFRPLMGIILFNRIPIILHSLSLMLSSFRPLMGIILFNAFKNARRLNDGEKLVSVP